MIQRGLICRASFLGVGRLLHLIEQCGLIKPKKKKIPTTTSRYQPASASGSVDGGVRKKEHVDQIGSLLRPAPADRQQRPLRNDPRLGRVDSTNADSKIIGEHRLILLLLLWLLLLKFSPIAVTVSQFSSVLFLFVRFHSLV